MGGSERGELDGGGCTGGGRGTFARQLVAPPAFVSTIQFPRVQNLSDYVAAYMINHNQTHCIQNLVQALPVRPQLHLI